MKNAITVLLLSIFSLINPVFAQDEISLDPVTITSSLLEKRASETGRSLIVIPGKNMANLPIHSVDDVLRFVPGLEIQARGPMGSQSDIVLRGGTYQQVLVMLDGLRLNDPNTGHFNSYIPIEMDAIDRIEVLKGAASSVYGSEAVGGVIHIISKVFSRKFDDMKVPRTSLRGALLAGEYGLRNGQVSIAHQKEGLAVSGGVLSNNARGIQQRGTRGFFYNNTATVSANARLSPSWTLAARASYDNRDFSAQNFYTTFKSDTATEIVRTFWNQLNVTRESENASLTFDLGYKNVKDIYAFSSASPANVNVSELVQGLGSWRQKFGNNSDWVGGLNYQLKSIFSNDRGNHSRASLAPFVVLNKRIGKHFIASPALRIDWRQTLGAEVVPQLNLTYTLDGVNVRANIGKTIRDADFTERFNNYAKLLVTSGSVGNPDLLAERSFAYEVGADWFVSDRLKVSATVFQRWQTNVIDFSATSFKEMPRKTNLDSNGVFALARNISQVTTQGVEIDAQAQLPLSDRHSLWATLGVTLLNSKSGDMAPTFYVSSHARALGNFSLLYHAGRVSLSLNGLYKNRAARMATDIEASVSREYALFNFRGEIDLVPNKLGVLLQIDNIFDEQYSDMLGTTMPGRWLMGGLSFSFDR